MFVIELTTVVAFRFPDACIHAIDPVPFSRKPKSQACMYIQYSMYEQAHEPGDDDVGVEQGRR